MAKELLLIQYQSESGKTTETNDKKVFSRSIHGCNIIINGYTPSYQSSSNQIEFCFCEVNLTYWNNKLAAHCFKKAGSLLQDFNCSNKSC